MQEVASRHQLTIVAYCLLPNHYHILARQDGEAPARYLPQYVFNAYSKAFNRRYGHSGTLFEGMYQAIEVYTPEYITNLIRYIHANPVLHGLVNDPFEWPYSDLMEWEGERKTPAGIVSLRDDLFDGVENYRRYFIEYLNTRKLPRGLADYLLLLEDF